MKKRKSPGAPQTVGHRHDKALLIIDMINTLDFPEGRALLKETRRIVQNIARLKARARRAGIPVIYVNDNFGLWRSDRQSVYELCTREESLGRELAIALQPNDDDYFVLKPKHSGFHGTTLEILLNHLGARTLILTGIAGNICVLFTANDAYMREYEVIVPRDGLASNTKTDNEYTLRQLRDVFSIDTRRTNLLRLASPTKRRALIPRRISRKIKK